MEDVDPRVFFALLTAVARREYEEDPNITLELLQHEVFSDSLPLTGVEKLYNRVSALVKRAVSIDIDFGQLEAFLGKTELKPAAKEAFGKFWRANKSKLHEAAVRRSTWNNKLQKLAWRIDVKTRTKEMADLNEPTAIVEATIAKALSSDKEVVRFEVDKEQLQQVLGQIESINDAISRVQT